MNSFARNGQVLGDLWGCVIPSQDQLALRPSVLSCGMGSVMAVLLLLWLRSISSSEILALTSMTRGFKVKLWRSDLSMGWWWVLSKQTHSRTHWPYYGPRDRHTSKCIASCSTLIWWWQISIALGHFRRMCLKLAWVVAVVTRCGQVTVSSRRKRM